MIMYKLITMAPKQPDELVSNDIVGTYQLDR